MKAPDHLAIDWIARNIYWTESELDRIEVARIDGSSRKIIISDKRLPKNWKMNLPDFDSHLDEIGFIEDEEEETELSSYEEE